VPHIWLHVELGVYEQRQLDLLAESADVSLRQQQFGRMLPSGA
jgi:hypothetical protein